MNLSTQSPTSAQVLVVEDNIVILKVLRMALQRSGVDATAVTDPEQALEILTDSDTIEVVVTDIDMPKFNGFELCTRARELNPDLKFIFISGAAGYSDLDTESHLERHPFLAKPFRISHFLEVLADQLGLEEGISPGPTSS